VDAIATEPVEGVADLGLSYERREALSDALAAFFSSRILIWAAGIAAVVFIGWEPGATAQLDHAHLTAPFHQTLANLLVSPGARWDSAWYLSIAKTGYVLSSQTVFFPLYPGLIALGGELIGQGLDVLLGIVISSACSVAALYLLRRLVSLEFDERIAHNTIWIFAWLPAALVLSAVYSEALFLMLAIGAFYAARTGRWAVAGVAGALAAATRNAGVLLFVPLLIIYLYGPRADREPDRQAVGMRPRYLPRRDLLWVALVPIGLLAYIVFLQLSIGQPLDPFTGQLHWGRHFIPLGGIPLGLWSAARAVAAGIPGFDPRLADHVSAAAQLRHLAQFGFLLLALVLLRVCWKRLPLAYTAFAAMSLAVAVSVPAGGDPLKSFPRFMLVLFPLWIGLALWATELRHVRKIVTISAPLLAAVTVLFVTWTWPP
jgi:hypothetical protein